MKAFIALAVLVGLAYAQPNPGVTTDASPAPVSATRSVIVPVEKPKVFTCSKKCDQKEFRKYQKDHLEEYLKEAKENMTKITRVLKNQFNCSEDEWKAIKQELPCKFNDKKFEEEKATIDARDDLSDDEKKEEKKKRNINSVVADCMIGMKWLKERIMPDEDGNMHSESPCVLPDRAARDALVEQAKRAEKNSPMAEP
ncbi:uncharacterized protein [Watersipora subatra]|uniref:uncharacterized protein n=1 Tax=Watersipora subatra TaxID=2589382 RepID=UPI00355B84B3